MVEMSKSDPSNNLLVDVQFQRPDGNNSGLLLALQHALKEGETIKFSYGKNGRTVKDVFRIFDTTIANAPRNRINKASKEAAEKRVNALKASGASDTEIESASTYKKITSYDVLKALAKRGNPEYAPNTWEAMKFGEALKRFLGYDAWIDEGDVSSAAAYMCELYASENNTDGFISLNDVMSDEALEAFAAAKKASASTSDADETQPDGKLLDVVIETAAAEQTA